MIIRMRSIISRVNTHSGEMKIYGEGSGNTQGIEAITVKCIKRNKGRIQMRKYINLIITIISMLLVILILLELKVIGGMRQPEFKYRTDTGMIVVLKVESDALVTLTEYKNDELFQTKLFLLKSIIDAGGVVIYERPGSDQ